LLSIPGEFHIFDTLHKIYKELGSKHKMVEIQEMTDREKELLNALGKYPDMSLKELVTYSGYKRVSYISRKIEQFKRQGNLFGPVYLPDWGKLCKNPLNRVFCILELESSYEKVISYLELIEPLAWIFPILSAHKKLLYVEFLSSHDTETKSLIQVLKDNNIITECMFHVSNHNKVIENPNLFGDFNPPLDNLLDPCDIPDTSYGQHQTEWNECDITIFPYLMGGYKGTKLIEILKAEKNLDRTVTYEQIKYSRDKMVKNMFIRKGYHVFPFPYNHCVHFVLVLTSEDTAITERMGCNFVKGTRVYKEYTLCKDRLLIEFISHPFFLTDLMHKLDSIDEIKEKWIYHVRSLSSEEHKVFYPPELKYFDFETQTVQYPYHVYRERIKEKLENEYIHNNG
jgi:hypothetical protein